MFQAKEPHHDYANQLKTERDRRWQGSHLETFLPPVQQ